MQVDQVFPSVIAGPSASAHWSARKAALVPSPSFTPRALKKSPLITKSNFSRAAILVGCNSVVCHLPGPSGSGPPAATRRCTLGLVKSTSATNSRVGGFVRVSEWIRIPGTSSLVAEIWARAGKTKFSSARLNREGGKIFIAASSSKPGFLQPPIFWMPGRSEEYFGYAGSTVPRCWQHAICGWTRRACRGCGPDENPRAASRRSAQNG